MFALLKNIFFEPKIDYMTEILKHSCHMAKKIIFVCENPYVEFIENKWKASSMNLLSI